jgi:hypothetical protein
MPPLASNASASLETPDSESAPFHQWVHFRRGRVASGQDQRGLDFQFGAGLHCGLDAKRAEDSSQSERISHATVLARVGNAPVDPTISLSTVWRNGPFRFEFRENAIEKGGEDGNQGIR